MKRLRTWALLAFAIFLLSPLQSFAAPGEASAIIQTCGAPSSDWQSVSEVTGKLQRSLVYGNTILRFDLFTGGWSYASAWRGHLPVSLSTVEAALPCVRQALNVVAKSPATVADPTMIADHRGLQNMGIQFGRPFLWLIAVLAAVLIVSLAVPATRRRTVRRPPLEARPYRRPKVKGFQFAQRGNKSILE
jgi:hypothetical protein